MNEFLAPFYESFFNYNVYQELLDMVFNNLDYGKFGWLLIIVPLIDMLVFYKLWEPIPRQRLKWFLTLLFTAVILYSATSAILYNNPDIMEYAGNYTGESDQVNPGYFIFQMSMITVLYSFIMSFIYSVIVKRFSTDNTNNPF